MTKSRREKQLDRTRRIEWLYYLVSFVVIMAGVVMRASPPVLWSLAGLLILAGFGVWGLQYRTMDELGRLRFLKSWALSGLLTSTALGGLVLWAAFQIKQNTPMVNLPFWSVYGVMVFSVLVASLSNVHLRRRDERE